MMDKKALGIVVMFLLAYMFFFPVPLEAQIFPKIMEAYRSIKDIKGRFSQKSTLKELKKEMSYIGVFKIKIPGKMFWRYEGDDLQEVYIKAETMLLYQKKHNQAIRTRFDAATIGQTPLALLSGMKDVDKDYKIEEHEGFVRLIPISPFFNINYIDIYPSDSAFPIKKIAVNDKKDNEIEIVLEDVEINTDVSDTVFDFKVPEGVKVVDH